MRVLVTGGGGFLGRNLALRLNQLGHTTTVLGRSPYSGFPPEIVCIQGDLKSFDDVLQACEGQDAVFHAAAVTGIWGDPKVFQQTNVLGTKNVLNACRQQNISRLIYTSSPSVIYNQVDIENGNESLPYPNHFLCDYARTKAQAEQMVLQANEPPVLQTVALRPHLIWGPGDPHLIPRIIDRARQRKLVRVGSGNNRVDIIYIDNAVEGHVKALKALVSGNTADGKAYFLSDGQPVRLWEWIDQLLSHLNLPKVRKSISYTTGRRIGAFLEFIYGTLDLKNEPRMTRFLAGQLATSHYFDISRAREDLGYLPVVSPEEGMSRLIRSLKNPSEY